jgi:hypothetical protein
MNTDRGNLEAVRDLVRETEVHRDVYIDAGVFALEMKHLFSNTWVYVGHDSQVPNAGDYFGTAIGTQPVLMVRHTDKSVHVRPRPAATPASSSAARITRGASRPTVRCSRSRCARATKTPALKPAMPAPA